MLHAGLDLSRRKLDVCLPRRSRHPTRGRKVVREQTGEYERQVEALRLRPVASRLYKACELGLGHCTRIDRERLEANPPHWPLPVARIRGRPGFAHQEFSALERNAVRPRRKKCRASRPRAVLAVSASTNGFVCRSRPARAGIWGPERRRIALDLLGSRLLAPERIEERVVALLLVAPAGGAPRLVGPGYPLGGVSPFPDVLDTKACGLAAGRRLEGRQGSRR